MTAQLGKRRPRLRWPFLVALVAMLLFAVIATLTGFLVSIGAPSAVDGFARDNTTYLALGIAKSAIPSGSFRSLTFEKLYGIEQQRHFGYTTLTTGEAAPFAQIDPVRIPHTTSVIYKSVERISVAICTDGHACREVVFAARGYQQRCWYARDLIARGSRPPKVEVSYALVKASRNCVARFAPRSGWSRIEHHVTNIG